MVSSLHSPPSLSIPSVTSKPLVVFPLTNTSTFSQRKRKPFLKAQLKPPRCSVSVAQPAEKHLLVKPSRAEVSRTIMELSSMGTLSTLTQEGWPLGVGVRFVVDPEGIPLLCLNAKNRDMSTDKRSSFHVQFEQCGSRSPQCTLIGNLRKPEDDLYLKKLHELWMKKFGEKVNEKLIYIVHVDRLLQMEYPMEIEVGRGITFLLPNFILAGTIVNGEGFDDEKEELCVSQDGVWVSSAEYTKANPDPLRNCAEKLVHEMNSENMEDVYRFCNIYVELGFEVKEAKMIWVDRLGFDVHIQSSQNNVYEARIPFPREVTDERGAKSSFNCMSQLAWEVEKSYTLPDFEKVRQVKEISSAAQ